MNEWSSSTGFSLTAGSSFQLAVGLGVWSFSLQVEDFGVTGTGVQGSRQT